MPIAIKRADGGVSIMRLTDSDSSLKYNIGQWKLTFPGQYVSHRKISEADIPTDRTFRGAWTDDLPTPTIDVDMDKAREMHRDHFRAVRSPILAKLDVEAIRADEVGDAARKAEVVAAKQALRDVTKHPDIEAAETPEELKRAAVAVLSNL